MQLNRIPASVSVTIPEEMADALAYWSRDALFSLGGSDETVTCVEIKPMADGSGHWAVFAYTYDRDGAEHSYRTVVDVAGKLVSVGEAGA
jgi:hypothetical protein